MKVRRKSEIAEAVQQFWKDGSLQGWMVTYEDGSDDFYSPERFAAHYEPFPEPPAAYSESILGRIELDKNMSPTEVKLRTSKQEVTIKNMAAPAWKVLPCRTCGVPKYSVLIEGVFYRETHQIWCGTEAEAKAKLESLRGENNGD